MADGFAFDDDDNATPRLSDDGPRAGVKYQRQKLKAMIAQLGTMMTPLSLLGGTALAATMGGGSELTQTVLAFTACCFIIAFLLATTYKLLMEYVLKLDQPDLEILHLPNQIIIPLIILLCFAGIALGLGLMAHISLAAALTGGIAYVITVVGILVLWLKITRRWPFS